MFAIPSIWASMNSWFTPTVLFVLLNVVIGTIAFTSSFANNQKPQQNDDAQPQIRFTRSPSVLQRIRSFNFHNHTHTSQQEPLNHISDSDSDTHFAHQQKYQQIPDSDVHFAPEQKIQQTHNFFHQTHFDPTSDSHTRYAENQKYGGGDESPSIDEVYNRLKDSHHVNRTNSDTKPSGGEMPERLPAKMRKSASAKSAFGHFEDIDAVEARRPATVREGNGGRATAEEDDEEVDSKADDFINKFKQQLKLQRLDSIIRYKDMISRGGGK